MSDMGVEPNWVEVERGICPKCGHHGRINPETGMVVTHPCVVDDVLTASGGLSVPMGPGFPFASEVSRPFADILPVISAPRGGIHYPLAGWAPPLEIKLRPRDRLAAQVRRRRSELANRLHAVARWVGDEPVRWMDEDDWWS